MIKSARLLLAVMSFTLLSITSCGEKDINPNKSSELAKLMRDMYDDGMRTKQQMINGEQPEINVPYHKITTAEATQPEKVALPEFSGFAAVYEASVKTFLEAKGAERVDAYGSMIDACMACHKDICPGPRRKIQHLYLTDIERATLIKNQK